MDSASINFGQQSTINRSKIHLSQAKIYRKVIAFDELINLKRSKKSARGVATLLEISNSTMQSWRIKINSEKASCELAEFFVTYAGKDFLQRNVIAVMKLMKSGPSGIQGMQDYLRNSGLDQFIASSKGALQDFWERCEDCILSFGEKEEKKLSSQMKHRKITVGMDEMFKKRRPCLVAIEVVSNYILLEKFTEDRKADTWKKELESRLIALNVTINQVVSDLCGAIRVVTEDLGAKHISELFHAQYEITKAISAPLASQERAAEKACDQAREKMEKRKKKPRKLKKEERKQQLYEIEKSIIDHDKLKIELRQKTKRREEAKASIKELGKITHPIDITSGKLQTAELIEKQFSEQFKLIHRCAEEANLSDSSIDRIEKGRRAFEATLSYVKYYYIVYAAFIMGLQLSVEQEKFFNETIFPLSYLKMIWRRLPKQAKKDREQLLNDLEAKVRDGPWPESLKKEWLEKGKGMAELFQRSSSCVEGRNGNLSLNYHRFHRLNERTLKALTIIHNFDVRRCDGTTAANRFFGAEHENLFEYLVATVRIPGKPQSQNHDAQNRKLGWEKRRSA